MPARINGLRVLPSATRSTGLPRVAESASRNAQEFAQRHAIRPFERYNEIDIGSSRIEISIAARRTENPESPNPEAPAQRGDFRAALGD
jgi:hypothetical protein